MKFKTLLLAIFFIFLFSFSSKSQGDRVEYLLDEGWRFSREDVDASAISFNDNSWQEVAVPHDWAIFGPFDGAYDAQTVAIVQDLEKKPTYKTGRTGGLPYMGVGWYRKTFDVPNFSKGKKVNLLFDGAMSEAHVYVNGREVGFWPYGYNSFSFDITDYLNPDGKWNVVAVRLENKPQSSRWYPGAGLYRNVHVIITNDIHIPVWGTQITTPNVSKQEATVHLKTSIEGSTNNIKVKTSIIDPSGKAIVASDKYSFSNNVFEQDFKLPYPELWSPETPFLYKAVTDVYVGTKIVDSYSTTFGVRKIELIPNEGFFLNGEKRKFRGVCNHHDLGPLGAAVNKAALRRQLTILKDMGCDAIRTSHNMPAPELVELCDEMGFMVMVENFDEWDIPKVKNGYAKWFNDWAEKDMINMLHNFRNNPSVIMWSIGNEVPSQSDKKGVETATFLMNICKREDPTRPVTCGMDQVINVLKSGMAALMDIPGFNYRVHLYEQAYKELPQKLVLGSETSSTVSSRGIYKFPVILTPNGIHDDHQCSSYDLEYRNYSNLPDDDFVLESDYDWTIGQFVWTGFDYLGEPSPYNWPNHCSMFGIIDLASIPKDRYYLYRSIWNKSEPTLHILPHWNWAGREGEKTPVFVYTSYQSAELFVNGKSQGIQIKNNSSPQNRFRLMWHDVLYEPGEIKVIAYDENKKPVAEKTVRTAGAPHHIGLIADRTEIDADGKDLAYINVRIVDKDGNLCPTDTSMIQFSVKGAGKYRASANGDPTCLEMFHLPKMQAFGGQLTAIVQSDKKSGTLQLTASARGVETATIDIKVKKTKISK
jgi:beta-galactosidase